MTIDLISLETEITEFHIDKIKGCIKPQRTVIEDLYDIRMRTSAQFIHGTRLILKYHQRPDQFPCKHLISTRNSRVNKRSRRAYLPSQCDYRAAFIRVRLLEVTKTLWTSPDPPFPINPCEEISDSLIRNNQSSSINLSTGMNSMNDQKAICPLYCVPTSLKSYGPKRSSG